MDVFEEGFEWDERKAGINHAEHGVRFQEAKAVFDDPYAITVGDNESDPEEERFVTMGLGALGRLLVVAFTYRTVNIRIISARQAEPNERKGY